MITKAYILEVNPQSNKFYVRIPIFDKPGLSSTNSEFSSSLFYATLSHEPTSKEAYKVGDTVFVGFENNDLNRPIIIGKLYTLGEEPNHTGAIDTKSLTVYDKAILPADTTIGSVNFSNIQSHIGSISNPHNVSKSQVGLGNVDNTSDGTKYVQGLRETRANVNTKIWTGTQAQYDAIVTKDTTTLYFITE